MSTVSQKRAEEYREKAESFRRQKKLFIFTGIVDLILAVIWAFLFIKKTSGMEFGQAVKTEPLYFGMCILFAVSAVFFWLWISFMRKLMFRDFDNEDIVE